MAKAVVSMSVGAEGLPVRPGEEILLADTPEHFAREVVRLLRDPAERSRLGEAGRRLVEREYSWPAVAEGFDRVLREVAVRKEKM